MSMEQQTSHIVLVPLVTISYNHVYWIGCIMNSYLAVALMHLMIYYSVDNHFMSLVHSGLRLFTCHVKT